MSPTAAILVTLMLISLMLAVILWIAWHTFGRPRHALIWSAAFGLAFVKWAALAAMLPAGSLNDTLLPMIGIGDCAIAALIAIGFRHRARRPARWGLYLGAAALAAMMMVGAGLFGAIGLRDAIPLYFGGLMLGISVLAVRRGRAVRLPERVAQAMLAFAFVLHVAAGALALARNGMIAATGDPLGAMLLVGLPATSTGTGLLALFLIALDLAERMRRLADSDPLTGVLNRRGFEERAARAIALARRQGHPITIAVADLDRFKAINDRFGHAAGDAALRGFARHVQRTVRSGDLFGRLGGEEFALLLVGASAAQAAEAVNRLRARIADMPHARDRPFSMTVSFGVTELQASDETLASLLDRADRALYLSKVGGRNRVTLAESAGLIADPEDGAGAAGRMPGRPPLRLVKAGSARNQPN